MVHVPWDICFDWDVMKQELENKKENANVKWIKYAVFSR